MRLPKFININEFNYDLPEDKIAIFPLQKRDNSNLLFYYKRQISSHIFNKIPFLLDDSHELIFNDTKVIRARMMFKKSSGSPIEIFLLEPFDPHDFSQSLNTVKECTWNCLVGNSKKWKDEVLIKNVKVRGVTFQLNVVKVQRNGSSFILRFFWEMHGIRFSDVIEHAGITPIPPYLNREAVKNDYEWYQTVYSHYEGSVAAPTAGLHFTHEVLNYLKERGINSHKLTLHVSAGTFIPVKGPDAMLHEMHPEQMIIRRESIEKLYSTDKKLICIGTTSVRILESLYWFGSKLNEGTIQNELWSLGQWEAYKLRTHLNRKEVLSQILTFMYNNKMEEIHALTRIMIIPGYNFKMTDGILTNFHQPKSTLLLLIAAFTGQDWKIIYDYALKNGFRFLSYGDSSLLLK